jgi:Protein of unknown function (DUF4230)
MKSSRSIPWSIGIAIILFAITASIYFLVFLAPLKTGGEVARTLKEFFDGTITVNKTVFIKGSNNMTELAVREKNITYTYDLTNSWWGSKKKIVLRGEFRGKAGYDFTDQIIDPKNPWGIDVSENGKVITARMPKPSILSVEMTNYKIIEDSNGLWNKISKDDREKAVNALQSGARTELGKTGILDEVDGAFIKQIEDALGYSAPIGLKVIREQIP